MKDLNQEEFDNLIKEEKTFLVDFWAEWCSPCKVYTPMLEDWSKDWDFPFYKLNVDENPQLARDLGIRSIPTTIAYLEGREATRIIGVPTPQVFKTQMHPFIKEEDER